MPENCTIWINGEPMPALAGQNLLVALMNTGTLALRTSISGEPRGALCGMGICYECRVKVNGRPHQKACQTLCEENLQVDIPREES